MNSSEINRAIAESVGWMFHPTLANTWRTPEQVQTNIRLLRTAEGPWSHPTEGMPPNYHGDLNAIRPIVLAMPNHQKSRFVVELSRLNTGEETFSFEHRFKCATHDATDFCTAYLRTISKWRNE